MRAPRLLVLGGTGYLGHHLLPRLSRAGYLLEVPSRNREQHRELTLIPNLVMHNADVHDQTTLARLVAGKDAVINLIGLLNEGGRETFQKVHVDLAGKLAAACDEAGVPRLLQMSALGAGRGESRYLASRGDAEKVIKASATDWTILQSSVIFGGHGGLVARFAGLLSMTPVLPLPCPEARMAPVHADDVAEAIVRAIRGPATSRSTLEVYGPQVFTLLEIVRLIATTMDGKRRVLPMPGVLGRLQASLAGLVPGKPFSRDNFLSLQTDSVGSKDGLRALGIEPREFSTLLPQLIHPDNRARRYNALRSQRDNA